MKAYVQFRGRAIVFKDRGKELLSRFLNELLEVGVPEYAPKLEERRMHVTIAPKKAPIVKKKKEEPKKEEPKKDDSKKEEPKKEEPRNLEPQIGDSTE